MCPPSPQGIWWHEDMCGVDLGRKSQRTHKVSSERQNGVRTRITKKQGPVAAFDSYVLAAVCALACELQLFPLISRGVNHSKDILNIAQPAKIRGKNMGFNYLVIVITMVLAFSLSSASDPSPLQDFCVAIDDPKGALFVNGKFCKDPNLVTADDFFHAGLNIAGNTSNPLGSKVTLVNVDQIPGLNTLGISLARIDFASYGLNPPHTHPRAKEVLFVLEGTLCVGFVTSNNPDNKALNNRLITKVLNPGDVFVFPEGLIHFQFNVGKTNAIAFAGLSSQNPGVITIANAVFGSNPSINPDVLTKAFQVDKNVTDYLQKQFWYDNN
ncbi:Cupin 1 [Dillenia turbinata]|uniref:Cupin 1 n=1 Tax=Dillenia turbinata TaxID=194707 RepID=A0AAN8VI13_9MAGN